MKKMKKFLSVLLASAMTLAMAAPGFAAGVDSADKRNENDTTRGQITVQDSHEGQTYTLYKIFDLVSYNKTNEQSASYLYQKSNSAWNDFFSTKYTIIINDEPVERDGYDEFIFDAEGYLTSNIEMEDSEAAQFAKDALEFAKANGIAGTKSAVAEKNKTLVFDNLDLGYYLLDSSVGALCSLGTTNNEITVKEKNTGVPSVNEKKITSIVHGVTTNNITSNAGTLSATIGDTINYEITVNAHKGAENYVLHDEMSTGLTLDVNTIVVKIGDEEYKKDTDYTVDTNPTDGDTFEINFSKAFCDRIVNDVTITITYSATLNDGANLTTGNKNSAKLTYGDKGKNEVPDKDVTVYSFSMPVFKYTGNNIALSGAEFELRESETGSAISVRAIKDSNGAPTGHYIVDSKGTDKITTGSDGKIYIDGLAEATYYLAETKAPTGYNVLTDPIRVKVKPGKITETTNTDDNGVTTTTKTIEAGLYQASKVESTDTTTAKDQDGYPVADGNVVTQVSVLNNAGALLPSTGGIGTTIFYAAGIILMAGAVFFVVRRKRA